MKKNFFISGEWNLTCDVCSKKIKAHEAKTRWDGFIVCGDCFENRHPQDFVKAQTDKISVPFQRPIPVLLFTSISYITLYVDEDYIEDHTPQTYFEEF